MRPKGGNKRGIQANNNLRQYKGYCSCFSVRRDAYSGRKRQGATRLAKLYHTEKILNTNTPIHTVKFAHDADCADNPDFFKVGLQRVMIQ